MKGVLIARQGLIVDGIWSFVIIIILIKSYIKYKFINIIIN